MHIYIYLHIYMHIYIYIYAAEGGGGGQKVVEQAACEISAWYPLGAVWRQLFVASGLVSS
jgi:hypothetical protein